MTKFRDYTPEDSAEAAMRVLSNLAPLKQIREGETLRDDPRGEKIAMCENGGCTRYVRENDDYVQVQSGVMHEGCTMSRKG